MKQYTYLIIFLIIGILLSAEKRKPKQQENIPNYFSLSDSNGKIIGVIDSEITPFMSYKDSCSQIYFSIINPFPDSVHITFYYSCSCAAVFPKDGSLTNNITLAPKEEKIFRLYGFCHYNWKPMSISILIESVQTGMKVRNIIEVLYNMNVYRDRKSRQEQTKENRE